VGRLESFLNRCTKLAAADGVAQLPSALLLLDLLGAAFYFFAGGGVKLSFAEGRFTGLGSIMD
jgi:hypothetical protein